MMNLYIRKGRVFVTGMNMSPKPESFRKLPVDYYLQAPYSGDLEENYQKFAELTAVK